MLKDFQTCFLQTPEIEFSGSKELMLIKAVLVADQYGRNAHIFKILLLQIRM